MAHATKAADRRVFSPDDPLAVPTEEEWRAMTPEERLAFEVAINEALSAPTALMGEGRPHKKAKVDAVDALGLHFRTLGRTVYLAEDMSVLYPGKVAFVPDVLAVIGVEQKENDKRMAWNVTFEKKDVDLILEVLHHGNPKKDLDKNVKYYAQLEIQEYFIFDALRQQIRGYELVPGAKRYRRIVPQRAHVRSVVLGVDLTIIGDNLRFLSGEATLPISAELIGRLWGIQENLEAKVEQAQVQVEQVQANADQAIAQGFREGLLALLDVRGIPCPDEARAHIESCAEASMLRRWLVRAKTAASIEEVFAADAPSTE